MQIVSDGLSVTIGGGVASISLVRNALVECPTVF
jgi:hypothetical protein